VNWIKETYGDYGIQYRFGETQYIATDTGLTGRDNRWTIFCDGEDDLSAQLAQIGEGHYFPTRTYAGYAIEAILAQEEEA
jgi:hypothetical protein